MLQTFLPLFLMTFGICLFIVLMQFLWRYIDDMVGKGLGIPVLAEMFMYAALFLVPMALPLAILLASLMTFGNLGERLELLAMKSAGVSLVHIMRPLIITISMISIGAFFFQNYAMPVVQVKLYTLLWSMRQKSPELDIPEGVFYSEITGFNVYVKHKDTETGLLRDMMIYDYSEGFNKVSVMVADSGRLKTSADKMFLVLSLFNGESFRSLDKQSSTTGAKSSVPYQRETFKSRDILIEFDANFSRTDESFMQNQFMGKNMHDLQIFIDSVSVRLDSIQNVNAKNVYETSYKKTLKKPQDARQNNVKENPNNENSDTKAPTETSKTDEPVIVMNFDSLYQAEGYGTWMGHDGSYYEGEWKNGERNGWGFSIAPKKPLRVGEWKKDRYKGERLVYTSQRIYGIDISKYQHIKGRKRYQINWKKLRITHLGNISRKTVAGNVNYPIRFIYIKSTEGKSIVNPYYKKDYSAARAHGYKVGTYHFFSTRTPAAAQANHFLRHSCIRRGDFPPVLDLEPSHSQISKMGGPGVLFARVRTWLRLVERATGVKPILYISQIFVNRYLPAAPDLKHNYKIWIARYGEYKPDIHLVYWQLCPDGRVAGIHGAVDINVFNGYQDAFTKFSQNEVVR